MIFIMCLNIDMSSFDFLRFRFTFMFRFVAIVSMSAVMIEMFLTESQHIINMKMIISEELKANEKNRILY